METKCQVNKASYRYVVFAVMMSYLWIGAVRPAGADPGGDHLLESFLGAYARVSNFRGQVKILESKGDRATTMRLELVLEKPNRTAMTILEAPENRSSEGTKMLWFGDRSVKVRTRFFGFPLTLGTGVDDDRLRDLRGNSLEDLNIVKAVGLLSEPGTTLRVLGAEKWRERPVTMLELRSPHLVKGIEREVIWLDDAWHLPLVREMYAEGKRVYRLEVESFRFDQQLPKECFSLD